MPRGIGLHKTFDQVLELLTWFQTQHRHLNVPQRFTTPQGYKLGNRCAQLRFQYKKGKLDSARIEALDNIGFVWNPLEAAFNKKARKFKKWRTKFAKLARSKDPEKAQAKQKVMEKGKAHLAWLSQFKSYYEDEIKNKDPRIQARLETLKKYNILP